MTREAAPDLGAALETFLDFAGLKLLQPQLLPTGIRDLTNFLGTTGFDTETEFDIQFLLAVHALLDSLGLVETLLWNNDTGKTIPEADVATTAVKTPWIIVLKKANMGAANNDAVTQDGKKETETPTWTCGIARQVRTANLNIPLSLGGSREGSTDHTLVLLQKSESLSQWKLSELRDGRDHTTCQLTARKRVIDDSHIIKRPNWAGGHDGVLAPVVASTLTRNLLGHCRTGSSTNVVLPKKLPLAVIACQSNDNDK